MKNATPPDRRAGIKRDEYTDWILYGDGDDDDFDLDGNKDADTVLIGGLGILTPSADLIDYPHRTAKDLSLHRHLFTPRMATSLAAPSGSLSPSTSPRLPSPPPFPEIQLGPKSPGPSMKTGFTQDAPVQDKGGARRIRPGTKAADMASGPPLAPLSELDSPFQLQEHLKALYHHYTKSDQNNATIAITRETALVLATPPENVDRWLWLYELCRLLVMKANSLIVAFFSDTPPCSAQTCSEMRASEWQYLCAVHDPPKSCCAIDYCCHTLDWAANILTSQKHFPSRLTLGNEASGGSTLGVKHLTNIFRRVYRIFAHAWFQHQEVFWSVEGHEGLYVLFKTVCDEYTLIPEDNYTIPPEAEGIIMDKSRRTEMGEANPEISATVRHGLLFDGVKEDVKDVKEDKDVATAASTTLSTGASTRRHKLTPSIGSSVTTILESEEADHSEDPTPTPAPAPAPAFGPIQPPVALDPKILSSLELPAASKPDTATRQDGEDTPQNSQPDKEVGEKLQEVKIESPKEEEDGEPVASSSENIPITVVEKEVEADAEEEPKTIAAAPE